MTKRKYNFNMLRGMIRAYYKTEKNFCEKVMNSSYKTFSSKLNNKNYFNIEEISTMAKALKINDSDAFVSIFFNEQVQNIEQEKAE